MEAETTPGDRPPDPQAAFSLVTVVYGCEITQLRLQARSLSHFATDLGLGEILVCVNDVNEDDVASQVEALRSDYGALSPLLRVVKGNELLGRPGRGYGPQYRLRKFWSGKLFSRFRRRGGWRGHDGWQTQQAMKLLAGRIARFPYVLMLDAKNTLIAPVEAAEFVADDGRPRALFTGSGELHWRWYPASARVLGLKDRSVPAVLTNFMTPYCITRDHLNAVVAQVEAQGWPVPALFCRPRNRVTEFMLISAYSQSQPSGLQGFFAPDILRSYTVFAGHSQDLADAILDEAILENGKIIGIHSYQIANLATRQKEQMEELVLRHGLFDHPDALWEFLSCRSPGNTAGS